MLKYVVLGVLLWHQMCKFSIRAEQYLADNCTPNFTVIALPQINDADVQGEARVNYNFYASHHIFYVNSPFGRSGFSNYLRNIDDFPRTDYVVTDEIGAHKVHRRKLTWAAARKICVDEGGNLAVIRSEAEEKFLVQMMVDRGVDEAWLGFHEQFQEGDWISVFDEPLGQVGWSHWAIDRPNNWNGNQHCALLHSNGAGMDDGHCGFARGFICKISIF